MNQQARKRPEDFLPSAPISIYLLKPVHELLLLRYRGRDCGDSLELIWNHLETPLLLWGQVESLGRGGRLDRPLGRELKLEVGGGMGVLHVRRSLDLRLEPGLRLGVSLWLELSRQLNLQLQVGRGRQLRLPLRLGLGRLEGGLRLRGGPQGVLAGAVRGGRNLILDDVQVLHLCLGGAGPRQGL